MKKKSDSPPLAETSGIWPSLIRWALMMIRLCAACRNTSARRTTGTTLLSITCCSTMPGPTDGNWSMSPTKSRLAFGGRARSRFAMSVTSTIEVSSTTRRSQSKGFASFRPKPPVAGLDFGRGGVGFGLAAGRARQALGCPAGGRTQEATHFLGPQDQQDGVDQSGLAHAGPTGDDQRPARQGQLERVALAGCELLADLFLTPDDGLVEINGRERGRQIGEASDPACDDFFGAFQVRQKDEFLTVDRFLDQIFAGQGALQSLGHDLVIHKQ